MSIPDGARFSASAALAGRAPQSAGDPQYPPPWTTSEPLEGLRDEGQARIVCLAPSVNLTPVGGEMVPVPYMIYDLCDHMENYSVNTFYTGQRVLRLCSKTTHVHGDEAGTGGGVKSGTVGSVCEPIGYAAKVRVEGSEVVRHLDRFWMEDRNTIGEALFVRDMGVYAAPPNDDPVPGSARMTRAAGGSGQVMSDVAPDASLSRPGAQLAFNDTTTGLLERAPTVEPPIVEPVEPPSVLTWGDFGKVALGEEAAGGGPEDPLADLLVLGTAIYLSVRISQEEKRKRRCMVDRYEVMKGVCAAQGMQAHHIVPDYTMRYGNRGEAEAGAKRIPGLPSFSDGMSICLTGNARPPKDAALQPGDPEREHAWAHTADDEVARQGSLNTPNGTLPMNRIIPLTVGAASAAKPECAPEITRAVIKQWTGRDLRTLGRSTSNLPTGDAATVLPKGARNDNWQQFTGAR